MKKLFKKVAGFAALALAALVPALSANAVTKTFYYDDSSTNYRKSGNSAGVAVHIWKDGGNGYPDSPISGTVVEGTDGKIYKFVIEDNNYDRFIFKPTDSWKGQSNDLKTTIEDKALYKADGPRQTVYISQSNYSEPSEPKGRWYLQGNNPMSWENVEARELKYNESTNCYELTCTIPASTDFKFVLNSNNENTYYRTKGNGDDNNNDEVELGADEQLYDVRENMYTLTEMKDVKIQIYKSDSNWKVRFGASPTTDIKVICKNTAKWDNVKISYWGDGQGAKTYDMTKNSGDLWEYTIRETWTPTGFTFSDGNGHEYKYNQAPENNTTYTNGDYVAPPTPGEISWYLQGNDPMTWENVEARKFKYNESTNCYELTYTIPASTDFKFVLNSNNNKTYYRTKGNGDDNKNDEVELGADEQLYVVGNNMYTRTEMKDVKIQIYKSDSNWKVRFGASPVQPDNKYYLLGDVNNWMNDGTYTTNDKKKEYGYGYSKAENGVRADYQFVPAKLNGDESWYVLDMSKTKTGGKLWGQFTIVQDKGVFQPAKLEENRNDGRDVINWNGTWEQWSNAYDRTSNKEEYLNETVKAYTAVPSDLATKAGVAEKVQRSNFHLDHNLYKGVKIYFNPTDQKIFMTYSDYQDFYIYLSTDADRKENGDRKVNVIKESMNNENYTLDFSSLRVVTSDGTQTSDTETLMEHKKITDESSEGDVLPNGLKFTNYWMIKIPNGLEGPSGQKFMVSIDGAQDKGAKAFTSIFLNNLYFIDGVRVFATPSADVEVAAVSYRIYGLPADGDPENLQIFAANGTQKAVKADPNDEFGWVDLQWGNFGYHPTSTSWWVGTVPDGYDQKTGFYPSFKDEARTVYHEVPASHASDCIQWKITYGKRPSAANGMKKTRTGVQLNPATADLTVDRSDLNADWVLNGRHKELEIGVATGVEDIEMEDGEISEEGEAVAPVYYNLQGVRVAEPQHGLYIKVTGNKSEKILVK